MKYFKRRTELSHSLQVTVEFEGGVGSNGVVAKWIDIWAAAVAVNMMCTARGLAGSATVGSAIVGKGRLRVRLDGLEGVEVGMEGNGTAVS